MMKSSASSLSALSCPVCSGAALTPWCEDKRRAYVGCDACGLVFVPASYHLSAESEKAEYDLHNNDVNDKGYRVFLSRVATPLKTRLMSGAQGLDFGCGPGPALVAMFEEAGFACAKYDLYYFPDQSVFDCRYDFITATEVVEHLASPLASLDLLWQRLKPGGVLALMTKRVIDQAAFNSWHYKNDMTHISFFADKTFEWLSERWQAKLEFIDSDVVFLSKPVESDFGGK